MFKENWVHFREFQLKNIPRTLEDSETEMVRGIGVIFYLNSLWKQIILKSEEIFDELTEFTKI